MNNPTIGIIGAKGKMGQAFAKLFESRGINVLEADINTKLRAEDIIKKADITIFSVPISVTESLIKELAPQAKSKSLITDFTAIKSNSVSTMLESAPSSCEVLGLHPIFGPSVVSDLSKQVFAACLSRPGELTKFLLSFFRDEGAIIKETTPEEHDRMMSMVQGLTHLSAIATAIALKNLGFNLEESFEFSSPIYRLRLNMIGRILSQSPQLYAEIAVDNPLTAKTINAYQDAISKLGKLVKNHDIEGFEKAFSEASDFLGDFKDEAYQRTTELIQRSKDIL